MKEKYSQMGITKDMGIWLAIHCWKIRKLNAELDGKPLAELIRLDEKLIVVIDEKEMKIDSIKITAMTVAKTLFYPYLSTTFVSNDCLTTNPPIKLPIDPEIM